MCQGGESRVGKTRILTSCESTLLAVTQWEIRLVPRDPAHSDDKERPERLDRKDH
jgi:hypothetical protein